MKSTFATAAIAGFLAFAPAAGAVECDPGKAAAKLTHEEARKVYDCIAADLHAGYMTGAKRWVPGGYVADYRNWTPVTTMPASPGFHDGRFLMTWVNTVGAAEYMKYAEEGVNIPPGTVIANETFEVTEKGKVKNGPLFIMEKVVLGVSPETDDWFYMLVAPNGQPQAIPVITDCSECHQGNFGHQGGLGYPAEDVRVKQ